MGNHPRAVVITPSGAVFLRIKIHYPTSLAQESAFPVSVILSVILFSEAIQLMEGVDSLEDIPGITDKSLVINLKF